MVAALVFLMLILNVLMTPHYSEGEFEITACFRGRRGRFGRCTPKSLPCNGAAHLDRSCKPTKTSHCCVPKRGLVFDKQPVKGQSQEFKDNDDMDALQQ